MLIMTKPDRISTHHGTYHLNQECIKSDPWVQRYDLSGKYKNSISLPSAWDNNSKTLMQ